MDGIEAIYEHCGESKNYFIYEPEEGAELTGKLYIRKSAATETPEKIRVILSTDGVDL